MVRKRTKIILLIKMLILIVLFQNCEAVHEGVTDVNSLSRYMFDADSGVYAFLAANQMAEKSKIRFEVDRGLYPGAVFLWDHVFEDGSEYCEQESSGDQGEFVEFICPSKGALTVDLLVEDNINGNDRFYFAVNILGEDEVLPPPDGETGNGKELYAAHCESCHNPLANHDINGQTADLIETAILNVGTMQKFNFLTKQELEYIASEL